MGRNPKALRLNLGVAQNAEWWKCTIKLKSAQQIDSSDGLTPAADLRRWADQTHMKILIGSILLQLCLLTVVIPMAFVMGTMMAMPTWLGFSFVLWSVLTFWISGRLIIDIIKSKFVNYKYTKIAVLIESIILNSYSALCILTCVLWSNP